MSWHCALPHSHVYTDPAGRYRLCCVAGPSDKTIHDHTISEYFHSDYMEELREEFRTGELDKVKTLCRKCIEQEKSGQTSYRQLWSQEIEELKSGERHMTFKLSLFGSYCNLSCYMCDPANSTKRHTELKKLGWLDEFFYEKHKPLDIQESLKQLEEFLPYTSAFVIIGGEPLLIDAHYKFLDGLIESGHADQICLSYTSNLTMSVDKFNTYVDKFKDVRMSASIDGLGERNDWIRYGSKFQTIIDNMGKLKCTKQVYYTTSVLSVFQCNEADKYFKSIGAPVEDFIIVDSFLSVRHMPHELKLELLDDIHIPSVREELKKPRDEKQWQKAMNYISDLDKTRKIKAKDIFDEIVPYLRDS